MGTHYAPSQDPVRLSEFAHRAADSLKKQCLGNHVVLCYRGLSGTSMATALMQTLFMHGWPVRKLGMFYARKPKEDCHSMGRNYECHNLPENPSEYDCYIFVDEFICSGDTMRAVDKCLMNCGGNGKNNRRLTHTLTEGSGLKQQYVAGNNQLTFGKRPDKEETANKVKSKEVKAETVVSGSARDLFPILKELTNKEKTSCRLSGLTKTSLRSKKSSGSHSVASKCAKRTSAPTRPTLRRPKR